MNQPTGYLIDHPRAVASRENPLLWPMELLRPLLSTAVEDLPDHYRDAGMPSRAFNQIPIGGCVGFSNTGLMNTLEYRDEGKDLFNSGVWAEENSTGAFLNYWRLKHGYGSYPGDGIPDAEGSYPEAFYRLAVAEGVIDRNGVMHKAEAYYSHRFSEWSDFDFVRQVIHDLGGINVGIPWGGNWFTAPASPAYKLPPFGGADGAHDITGYGWDIDPDGKWILFGQTWGEHWTDIQGTFRLRADWLFGPPLGPQIVWKLLDRKDAPAPPAPDPGGTMLTIVDKAQRMVDTTIGAQVYKVDGLTPLTPIKSGPTDIVAPYRMKDASGVEYYAIGVQIGGVLQFGTIKATACTNVRDVAQIATEAEAARWEEWLATAPK